MINVSILYFLYSFANLREHSIPFSTVLYFRYVTAQRTRIRVSRCCRPASLQAELPLGGKQLDGGGIFGLVPFGRPSEADHSR